jgi:hypothetical protein
MTKTSVATKVHQSLERSGDLSSEISLYLLSALDNLSDLINLLFSEVVSPDGLVDSRLSEDCFRLRFTNSVNVCEPKKDSLITRKVNTCNTWHDLNSYYYY